MRACFVSWLSLTIAEAIDAPLADFDNFFGNVNATAGFDNGKLHAVLENLRNPVEHSLHGKVDAVLGLKEHPNLPGANSLEASLGASLLRRWRENTAFKVGYTDVVPFFLLNSDRWFERGLWMHWPGMHWAQRFIHVNLISMWHGPRWKFSSCDADGKPRELYVFRSKPGEKGEGKEAEKDEKAEL